jgi:hypothetical protein
LFPTALIMSRIHDSRNIYHTVINMLNCTLITSSWILFTYHITNNYIHCKPIISPIIICRRNGHFRYASWKFFLEREQFMLCYQTACLPPHYFKKIKLCHFRQKISVALFSHSCSKVKGAAKFRSLSHVIEHSDIVAIMWRFFGTWNTKTQFRNIYTGLKLQWTIARSV